MDTYENLENAATISDLKRVLVSALKLNDNPSFVVEEERALKKMDANGIFFFKNRFKKKKSIKLEEFIKQVPEIIEDEPCEKAEGVDERKMENPSTFYLGVNYRPSKSKFKAVAHPMTREGDWLQGDHASDSMALHEKKRGGSSIRSPHNLDEKGQRVHSSVQSVGRIIKGLDVFGWKHSFKRHKQNKNLQWSREVQTGTGQKHGLWSEVEPAWLCSDFASEPQPVGLKTHRLGPSKEVLQRVEEKIYKYYNLAKAVI